MNYESALEYIHAVQWAGHKPGLTRTRTLLAALGDPHKQLQFIHVAGTKSASAPTAKPAPGPNTMPASSTGRLPRLNRTKPVEMLSTQLNTMLMAMSRASTVRVRVEFFVLFISIVLP